MSDSNDNSGWLWILFFILFLGPCQATERNERKIKDNEREIEALERENDRLEHRVEELEEWKESR